MIADSIARLKITLDDVEPQVLRRVDVPHALRLDRLHLVLQAAMGWSNYHLWEIRARNIAWGPHQRGWDDARPLNAAKASLLDLIGNTGVKTLKYLYDFGDGWTHTVKCERLLDAEPDASYPLLIEATRRCPPEDVGGPAGYEEFLAAIANRDHERHAELIDWWGGPFDPAHVDVKAINDRLAKLAKRWAPKPAPRRATRY